MLSLQAARSAELSIDVTKGNKWINSDVCSKSQAEQGLLPQDTEHRQAPSGSFCKLEAFQEYPVFKAVLVFIMGICSEW